MLIVTITKYLPLETVEQKRIDNKICKAMIVLPIENMSNSLSASKNKIITLEYI